ncbi:MAG: NAD(P)-binding protein [Candidatus Electryonea clarkiae]|nr:NAD(P)-binding protein [Candidatus Electryonea clarkiae]MDP8287599.1 NAD(P)-binding protein [Candidatus Electryonea clarkiae]
MAIHKEIFSDEALRHVREGSAKPPGQLSADEIPPMAASWANTEKMPVGGWKENRPRYLRGLSPCLAHCPVGNDVEGFVSTVREGDVESAARLLAAETPLPATCGRVCYHPCESGCNRVQLDGSVGIRAIERYLGDLPYFDSANIWSQARPATGKNIAIAGSGPGGLASAWALSLLGHKVEIFERKPEPGGLLLYGIPAYRLPKDILSKEIGRIKDMGVRINCGVNVGEAKELSKLLESYDSVFVATGAAKSRDINIKGDNNKAVYSAIEYLSEATSGNIPETGRECIIIGGGNSAVDAARSAKRSGANVTIVYRRTRAEMPAYETEIDDALKEGIQLEELAIPLELIVENGSLTGMKCLKTKLGEPDDSGRRSPIPVPGSDFVIPASSMINALGEIIDKEELTKNSDFQNALSELNHWGSSNIQGLFAGGDFVGGDRTVAHAIGGGKRAAMAIDRFLLGKSANPLESYIVGGGPASLAGYLKNGESDVLAEGIKTIQYKDLNPAYFPNVEREELAKVLDQKPDNSFREVESGYTPEEAKAEANRCFSCGRCTNCGLCQIFCPEGAAVHRDPQSKELMIFDSHCKGCGICVEECPRCALVMEPVNKESDVVKTETQ